VRRCLVSTSSISVGISCASSNACRALTESSYERTVFGLLRSGQGSACRSENQTLYHRCARALVPPVRTVTRRTAVYC
jgi:hypothetical protein